MERKRLHLVLRRVVGERLETVASESREREKDERDDEAKAETCG